MPSVYISPSTQNNNICVLGDTELIHCNFAADALVPYMPVNGIEYKRNNPEDSLGDIIAESNAGNFDLHAAIHTNSAPGDLAGTVRGVRMYYQDGRAESRQFADLLVTNFKKIYPLSDLVYTMTAPNLAELRQVNAPSVIMELGFHDNEEDAAWFHDNIQIIAKMIARSITEYFGKSLIPVCISGTTPSAYYNYTGLTYGRVAIDGGHLNLRSGPGTGYDSLEQLRAGTEVVVLAGVENGFVKVRHNHTTGFVAANYLRVCNIVEYPFTARLGTVKVSEGNLNIRAWPSMMSSIVAKAPNGSKLVVIGDENDDFYRVSFEGQAGFAAKRYITFD